MTTGKTSRLLMFPLATASLKHNLTHNYPYPYKR